MNTPAPNDTITLRNEGPYTLIVEVNGKEVIREFYASGESAIHHTYHWYDEPADLTAPVAEGGEVERLREVARMVDQWGNGLRHHTAHESKMVKSARKALQQTPAPAVDLESLYKGNRHNETDYNQGWNDCIDHLAAQGMIKGVE